MGTESTQTHGLIEQNLGGGILPDHNLLQHEARYGASTYLTKEPGTGIVT